MATQVLGAENLAAGKTTKEKLDMDYVTLNNGVRMPILGYGTLKLPESTCADCVAKAIETGWRLIDTARNYANERQVGEGIRRSGIDRKELFVTSKLWIKDYDYSRAKQRSKPHSTVSGLITLTSTCCTSLSAMCTGYGGHWRNFTARGR